MFPPNSKEPRKIIDGLNQPYGLAMLNGYLYVAENDSVKRYKYDAKAMTAAGPGQEVISLKGQGTHHWTRSLLFDRAGKKLYVGVGSGSNSIAGRGPAPRRHQPLQPRRQRTTRFSPPALRNPIGLRWYPGTDTLWAAVQERDDLGDDLVPDYFTHIQQGGFYGWPYAYIGPHEDPTNKGQWRPRPGGQDHRPRRAAGRARGRAGLHFLHRQAVPRANTRAALSCAFHGSWNRSMRVGQSVAFIPFKDGKPAGPMREVRDRLDARTRPARSMGPAGGFAATARWQPADLRGRRTAKSGT